MVLRSLTGNCWGCRAPQHTDAVYEVEFINAEGETVALWALPLRQFTVVWRAETRQWVEVAERVAQIVARLPEEARAEGLTLPGSSACVPNRLTRRPHEEQGATFFSVALCSSSFQASRIRPARLWGHCVSEPSDIFPRSAIMAENRGRSPVITVHYDDQADILTFTFTEAPQPSVFVGILP
jgi:hypothetical protein